MSRPNRFFSVFFISACVALIVACFPFLTRSVLIGYDGIFSGTGTAYHDSASIYNHALALAQAGKVDEAQQTIELFLTTAPTSIDFMNRAYELA
jgi:hypothetical protein